jgi:hypothetical protein
LSPLSGAETPRDLELDLHHAQVAFCQIIN